MKRRYVSCKLSSTSDETVISFLKANIFCMLVYSFWPFVLLCRRQKIHRYPNVPSLHTCPPPAFLYTFSENPLLEGEGYDLRYLCSSSDTKNRSNDRVVDAKVRRHWSVRIRTLDSPSVRTCSCLFLCSINGVHAYRPKLLYTTVSSFGRTGPLGILELAPPHPYFKQSGSHAVYFSSTAIV